jgi:transmembrane sensor
MPQNTPINDDDWQEVWRNPDEIDPAKKRALLEGIHRRMDEGRGTAAGKSRRTPSLLFIGLSAVAAALIILFVKFNTPPVPVNQWRELASNETSRKITLDDSSIIWLAPHSVVRVYPDFSGHRTTSLVKGIAFFKVTKDEQHQFSVAIDQQKVVVLGTSFMIRKLDAKDLQLMVKDGKVALDNSGGRQVLTAGQQINTTRPAISSIDPSEADWWLQEQVRWHNVALKDLLSRLEDYYQIKLTRGKINEELKVSLTWDMTISMEKNLAILNALTGYNIH